MALEATNAIYILLLIGIMLFLGIVSSIISKKLNISEVILLILAGMVLGILRQGRSDVFVFGDTFLISISILALSLIVFDGTSRFSLWELDKLSLTALKAIGSWFLLNLTAYSLILVFVIAPEITIEYLLVCMIFAIMMVGTDPASVFVMLKDKTNRIIEFLKVEALFNTPLIVIFPILLLQLKTNYATSTFVNVFIDTLKPFFLKLIVGVGTGFLIGAILFKPMKKFYSEKLSPIALIAGALLAYGAAEVLGGDGVLSVATLGLFFGQVYLKEKYSIQEFNSVISNSLNILVFVLIGAMISLPLEFGFYITSFLLYVLLVLFRYLSLKFALRKEPEPYTNKELIFMSLMMPKGIAIAALAFTLKVIGDSQVDIILHYVLIFMIYSLIVSTVFARFYDKFIIEKKPDTKKVEKEAAA